MNRSQNEHPTLRHPLASQQLSQLSMIYEYAWENCQDQLTLKLRKLLPTVIGRLRHLGIPTIDRRASSCWNKLGQFASLSFMLPASAVKLSWDVIHVRSLRDGLKRVLTNTFGDDGKYSVGHIVVPEIQVRSDRHPGFHFHAALSLIRGLNDPYHKRLMAEFRSWNYRKRAKRYAYFFRAPPVTFSREIDDLLRQSWFDLLEETLALDPTSFDESMYHRSGGGRRLQTNKDRLSFGLYIKNGPLKPWRGIRMKFDPHAEQVYLRYNDNAVLSRPIRFHVVDFLYRYLELATYSFDGLASQPSGHLHGRSYFAKIISYAQGQFVHTSEGLLPFLDQHVWAIYRQAVNTKLTD